MKRCCCSGGMSRSFSTHFGGKPSIPRAFGWPFAPPFASRLCCCATILRSRHSRRRSPSCARTVCAANPVRSARKSPKVIARCRKYIPPLVVAFRAARQLLFRRLHVRRSQLRQRIHLGDHVVVLKHAQILD